MNNSKNHEHGETHARTRDNFDISLYLWTQLRNKALGIYNTRKTHRNPAVAQYFLYMFEEEFLFIWIQRQQCHGEGEGVCSGLNRKTVGVIAIEEFSR
jgi:hypothetical protein